MSPLERTGRGRRAPRARKRARRPRIVAAHCGGSQGATDLEKGAIRSNNSLWLNVIGSSRCGECRKRGKLVPIGARSFTIACRRRSNSRPDPSGWARSGDRITAQALLAPFPAEDIVPHRRHTSLRTPCQWSSVSATVLRARLGDRAICRSLAPPSCFRRRISRTIRIDTLSAGIGPRSSFLTSRGRRTPPSGRALATPPGVADFRSEWPRSNRNQWPTSHSMVGMNAWRSARRPAPSSADPTRRQRSAAIPVGGRCVIFTWLVFD